MDKPRPSIYVASKTLYARRWRDLREAGYPIISTWIDEAGAGQTRRLDDLAVRCIQEAASADITLLFCQPGDLLKGALLEVGAALAAGKEVRCVGYCECIDLIHQHHPQWHFFPNLEAALGPLQTQLPL